MPLARLLLLCLAGCVPDGAPAMYTSKVQGGIGSACGQDSDCQNGFCFTDGNWLGYKVGTFGGFCSRACSSDAECGSGLCLLGNDGNQYCTPACDQPSNCRDDYLCDPVGRNHCAPVSLFTLDCDPSTPDCTTESGVAGGCLRFGLGTGILGVCATACPFGTRCPTGQACHYLDDTGQKGTFQGMLCFNAATSPLALGQSCSSTLDCVSGANCVNGVLGMGLTCDQLCNPVNPCLNDATCDNFVPPALGVGVCDF